jgi:hypothetical protein
MPEVRCSLCVGAKRGLDSRRSVDRSAVQHRLQRSSGGNVVAKGKQGDTLRVPCTNPMEIEVKVNGWFGKPKLVVHPGERYNAKAPQGRLLP